MIDFTTSLNNLYNTIAKADCNPLGCLFAIKFIKGNPEINKIVVNTAKEMTLIKDINQINQKIRYYCY